MLGPRLGEQGAQQPPAEDEHEHDEHGDGHRGAEGGEHAAERAQDRRRRPLQQIGELLLGQRHARVQVQAPVEAVEEAAAPRLAEERRRVVDELAPLFDGGRDEGEAERDHQSQHRQRDDGDGQ